MSVLLLGGEGGYWKACIESGEGSSCGICGAPWIVSVRDDGVFVVDLLLSARVEVEVEVEVRVGVVKVSVTLLFCR